MFTLKEHQKNVDESFENLIPISWEMNKKRKDNKKSAFVLQAPTGAGKTINIGKVLMGLVNGVYEGLNKGPILFVSASPDLNIQTLKKIEKAYPVLRGKVTSIENDFNETMLRSGHVYFINTQKLGKNKMLTKGDADGSHEYNFWEVWGKACLNESSPAVLVIDESHQGMGGNNETIAKRLLQGKDKQIPVPLVIGVSATPSKFEKIIKQTHHLEYITVSMKEVKDSGLIKETINIHYQGEKKGDFESILLNIAAKEYVKYENEWMSWCKETGMENAVIPLMVVQVKDHVKEEELVDYALQIADNIPSISNTESFAHNITGISGVVDMNGVKIHQVDPSDVQDDTRVKVFFVKESAAVGWDCPRAEVLLSYRPHSDDDYILQMIGRMLRTPLAQRIEGNEVLNTTSVILPYYDIEKVENINEKLRHGGVDGVQKEDDEDVIQVSLNPVEVSCVNDTYKDVLESLQSFTIPSTKKYSPVLRMYYAGYDLSRDDIIKDFEVDVVETLAKEIVSLTYKHEEEISRIVEDLKIVKTEQMTIDAEGETSVIEVKNPANAASLNKYLEYVSEVFGSHITQDAIKQYLRMYEDSDEDDAVLAVSAASYSDLLIDELNDFADRTVSSWLTQTYKRNIKRLNSTEREAVYNAYLSQSPESMPIHIMLPEKYEINSAKIKDGKEVSLPYIDDNKHVFSDSEGKFYHNLSDFETQIIEHELQEQDTIAFYRNPSHGVRSLKVPYMKDKVVQKVFAPDFIVLVNTQEGIKASIVDPHGTYLEDALDKLQGLALYAEQYGDQYVEIRAISDAVEGIAKVLELTDEATRTHVLNCETIAQAYQYDQAQEVKMK